MTKRININGKVFELGYCEKMRSFMTSSSCKKMKEKCKKLSYLPEHLRLVFFEDLLICDLPCLSCSNPIN